MIPGSFEYHAPESVKAAIKLLVENEDAKLIAGGHSLLPMMKFRFAEPPHLIDMKNIDELKGIELNGSTLSIGSMTTENELIDSSIIQQHCPLLAYAATLIADPQVRNKGTLGGDIAHGDPGNDHPALMMALDAVFVIEGPEGEREEPANGFYLGTYWTQLEEQDILKRVLIPVPTSNSFYGYNKLKRKTGDFATAGATVILTLSNGICSDARITLTNVGATALRAEDAEQVLIGNPIDESLINQAAIKAMEICEPMEDLRGDSQYKTQMAGEMVRRSIRDALQQAKG